jgi:hypothetical protein
VELVIDVVKGGPAAPSLCLADVVGGALSAEHALECLAEAMPLMTVADLAAAIEVEVLELAWDETSHRGLLQRTIEMLARLMCTLGDQPDVTLRAAYVRLAQVSQGREPGLAVPPLPRI